MVELGGHLVGAELRWNSVDSCGGTRWTVAVELGRQLWWNSVDSGTQWTVELSGQLRWNLVDSCGRV